MEPRPLAGRVRGALGVVAFATLLTLLKPFYGLAPIVFDEWLALPIARALAEPDAYPASDLLVTAGLAGPFWVYKLAAWVYRLGWNVELVWGVAFLAAQAALFASAWRLLRAISLPGALAALALVLLAASPSYRGTLNWTQFPFFAFVTAGVAVPLLLLAVADAFTGRHWRAAALAGLAFAAHPGAGVIAGCAVAVVSVALVPRERWRALAGPAALGCLVALPNVVAIARAAGGGATAENFLPTFRHFAVHVYPTAHWRENYAFFALLLAAGLWGAGALAPQARRGVRILVAAMMGLLALYALNAATFEIVPVLLLYLYRVTWVLKPVLVGCACAGVAAWVDGPAPPARGVKLALAATAAAAVIVPFDVVGDAFAAIAVGGAIVATRSSPAQRGVATLLVLLGLWLGAIGVGLPVSADVRGTAGMLQIAILGGALALFAVPLAPPSGTTPAAPRAMLAYALGGLAFVCLAPLVLPRAPGMPRPPWAPSVVMARFRFLHAPPGTTELYAWAGANTPPGALFLTPPTDQRFLSFRALTGRGQYVTVAEVNQLAYDPALYQRAAERLGVVGVQVVARGIVGAPGYRSLPDSVLRAVAAEGVTHAVFPADSPPPARPWRVAYRDQAWVVLDLGAPAQVTP